MLSQELWLSQRLSKACGEGTFTGITDGHERKERAAALIKRYALAEEVCGKRNGKPVTFADMYQIVYRTPLEAAA